MFIFSVYRNLVFIPLALLNHYFFHKDLPNYSNYGAIGTIVGHEMTHGFDELGHQYDEDGEKE